jgi:hypothetical protein
VKLFLGTKVIYYIIMNGCRKVIKTFLGKECLGNNKKIKYVR